MNSNANIATDKEYVMTQRDFDEIAHMALVHTGIVLGPHKISMVYSRIARRLRALKLPSFRAYLDYLNSHFEDEISEFINHITTNLTSFFREQHHFDYLKETIYPQLKSKGQNRVRIWSSGCSIGQEAYSIAITIRENSFPVSCDIKILATDLDSNVVNQGAEGVYPTDSIQSLSKSIAKKYFQYAKSGDTVRVKETLKNLVFFKRLNLLEEWPVKGPFDVIFCRNVVIYFNKDTQRVLFDRYAELLPIGGYLFIGHSESLNGLTDRFESLGNTIYRKIK